MADIVWNADMTITCDVPKKPKKITGTRFGAILDRSPWATPFGMWCEITKTYQEPFVDTIYTIAGKVIEPKQAEYIKDKYFYNNLKSPTDVYGKDYFNKTWGDFFKENKIFGGMWDYLFTNDDGEVTTVLEMKTTKRSEDWQEGIPEYYALQASLYAHLLGVDDVMMVCTILEDEDYEHPENFIVTEKNTFEVAFKVSERYPHFDDFIKYCENWWDGHVERGISPVYDEDRDAVALGELRKNTLNDTTDIDALISEAESLCITIAAAKAKMKEAEDRYKVVTNMLKEYATNHLREGDTKVVIEGNEYDWTLSKSESKKVDEKLLKKDGLFDKYAKISTTYRFTNKKKEV